MSIWRYANNRVCCFPQLSEQHFFSFPNILFWIKIWTGVFITGLSTILILGLHKFWVSSLFSFHFIFFDWHLLSILHVITIGDHFLFFFFLFKLEAEIHDSNSIISDDFLFFRGNKIWERTCSIGDERIVYSKSHGTRSHKRRDCINWITSYVVSPLS